MAMKVKKATAGEGCGENECNRLAVITLDAEVGDVSPKQFPLCEEHWRQLMDAGKSLLGEDP